MIKAMFGCLSLLLRRYTTVAYLDCDLGQPEFTPSGFLSLSLVKEAVVGEYRYVLVCILCCMADFPPL